MSELRYAFGQNWSAFVDRNLSDAAVDVSARRLSQMVRAPSLVGADFLDIGCGSGLHALAALRLGAERVVAFDYDPDSVATSERVRAWAGISPDRWRIFQGSVLDDAMMADLGAFDVVYSWGVLHHTGDMWRALANAIRPLKPDGTLYVALYSSDIYVDPTPAYWRRLKRAYNHANPLTRTLMEFKYAHWRMMGESGLSTIQSYNVRGMNWLTDVKDWLGGYPIEFAGFAETVAACRRMGGLDLVNVAAGEGCTEYVFARLERSARWRETEAARRRVPMQGPFRCAGGAAWTYPLAHLSASSDGSADRRRSALMVYEDGAPLGLAHALHDDIRRYGGGRFSHWGGELLFSARDGSDPNMNARAYAYCDVY